MALPIMFLLFGRCAAAFFERALLDRCSVDAVQGAMNGFFLSNLFAWPCVALANMTQVFVGGYLGAGQNSRVGPCTWQMIWFSLLSMIVTLPLSVFIVPFFFKDTAVGLYATDYFRILAGGNFLLPLGAVLAAFFLAQKQIWIVIKTVLISCVVNSALAPLLIFGIKGILPPLEAAGAALAFVLSQLFFCVVLFRQFISQKNYFLFATDRWKIDIPSLMTYVKTGLPRAAGRIALSTLWMGHSIIMTAKGGDYLLVITLGSALTYFFLFFAETVVQTTAILASRYLGSGDNPAVKKVIRSGMFITLFFYAAIGLLFVGWPHQIISLFFPSILAVGTFVYLKATVICALIWSACMSLGCCLAGVILARKETLFWMLASSGASAAALIAVYVAMNIFDSSPEKFWIILSIEIVSVMALSTWKLKRLEVKPSSIQTEV